MTGSLLVDVGLVLVLVGYAVSGYRQGLITSVCGLVGFFTFALVAVWQLPRLLARFDAVASDGRLRVLFLVVGVLGFGWLGQALGAAVGGGVRRRMGLRSLRRADSALGAVVVLLAASLIVWFIGGSLRTAGAPGLTRAVSESRVLQGIDRVVPEEAGQVFGGVRQFLSAQGFPQVFGDLGPEPIAPVQEPDSAVGTSAVMRTVSRSVVKVLTASGRCDRGSEGTGWVVGPGRVVTNAHVVAGADRLQVENSEQALEAVVVLFDPDRDLAVLRVDDLEAAPLPLGPALRRGDSAAVPGYPLDGPYTVVPARVRQTLDARGLDIYGSQRVVREIYSLSATVQPGNSGGPLVDPSGRVVGVIFAKSLEDDRTGYALTLAEAKPVLDRAGSSDRTVDTGACLAA